MVIRVLSLFTRGVEMGILPRHSIANVIRRGLLLLSLSPQLIKYLEGMLHYLGHLMVGTMQIRRHSYSV